MRIQCRTLRLAGFVLLTLLPITACVGNNAEPIVVVEQGTLRGVDDGDVTVFRGVPFASPPVGDLRWREPRPAQPWSGVRQADRFAPACMQTGASMPGEPPPSMSEDCLYLNVWVPDTAETPGPLPVMVWIHGGGFSNGAASFRLYDGTNLARRGVIVVSIAYRVGPFGFLAHSDLTAESPHGTSGNYGLMDQVAALRWIQDNIGAFGGDPGRVTLFGQSAGAISIAALMASPLTQGLFHGAIGQSGGLFVPIQLAPDWFLENAEQQGERYLKSIGAESVAVARGYDAEALLGGQAGSVSHPVIEPYLLPIPPYERFLAGEQAGVPLLVGSNADEARSLMDPTTVRAETFMSDITARWGSLPAALLEAYPYETDEEARRARLDFERELRFGWDVWIWARLHSQTSASSVYYYHFAHEPPFPAGTPYEGWGPSHFAELWYVFDQLGQEAWHWTPADRDLADIIATYWTNFAKSGNPNGDGVPSWPSFTADTESVLYLTAPVEAGPVPNLRGLRVFDAVYEQIRTSAATP